MPTRGVEMYIGLYLAREFESLEIFTGFAGLLGENWGFQNYFFCEITIFVLDLSFTIFLLASKILNRLCLRKLKTARLKNKIAF